MENIRDWCISRQLWWGHRIPVWYGPDKTAFAARSGEEAQAKAAAHCGKHVEFDAGSRCARHLVQQRPLALQHPRLARADRGPGHLLPDHRAGDRLRHHLLLGGANDHDGSRVHGRGAVPLRLPARPRPRRAGPQDEQEPGQRPRPARPDRPVRHRCAALHPAHRRHARQRHEAGREPRRGQPQLRQQDLERGPLRDHELG